MADPPQIRQTRKNLGQRLAELRRAAGLNQHELAAAVNYARSTVANIEVGRQNAPAEFWERCDTILNAAGTLRAGYHALCLAQSAHRHDEARRHPSAADPAAPAHDAREGLAHGPVIVVGSPVLAGRLAQLLAPGMVTSAPTVGFAAPMPDWDADTLVALTDLGRVDVELERRHVLTAAAYSAAALALPGEPWWTRMAAIGRARRGDTIGRVGTGDVDAVRDTVAFFSGVDQRRGGGHARTAVVQYLASDVARFLQGPFSSDRVRRDMFCAASELAYLAGWMSFDNADHAVGQHFFTVAVKLAAEADDPPMAGHVLRAMAHQAVDLGHVPQALDLASASMDGARYKNAAPRERALLGVVHARALSASGDKRAAADALLRAENDLASAEPGDDEPSRVHFFGEASLAHETACALRDVGDLPGAIKEFERSVRTRKAIPFARTHAVTLGYLGAVHARCGNVEQACATWSAAIDAMDGVRSGRTRRVATEIRATLAPLRRRRVPAITDLDRRAARYLAATA